MALSKWIQFQTSIAACLCCCASTSAASAQSASTLEDSTSKVSDHKKSEPGSKPESNINNKKLIREESTNLTREGVSALCKNDFPLAISKFEHAIRLNPNAQMARTNLAIAYSNYGLTIKDNAVALHYFRQSYALNPNNENVRKNIEKLSALTEPKKTPNAANH